MVLITALVSWGKTVLRSQSYRATELQSYRVRELES
jgi:hypothetical protein